MYRFLAAVAVTCLVVNPAAAAAPSTSLNLTPSSTWNLDYAKDSCKLRRVFGVGDQAITLEFERQAPVDGFDLLVFGPGIVSFSTHAGAEVTFGSNPPFKTDFWYKGVDSADTHFISTHFAGLKPSSEKARGSIQSITPAEEAAVRSVTLKNTKSVLSFATGSMGAAFASLRHCEDDLVRAWGLDPQVQRKLSRLANPKGDAGYWLTTNDYPREALMRNHVGKVNFRLMVDELGKTSACFVQSGLATGDFDKVVCRLLMKRSKFIPALDAMGKPVASFWVSAVNFSIPE